MLTRRPHERASEQPSKSDLALEEILLGESLIALTPRREKLVFPNTTTTKHLPYRPAYVPGHLSAIETAETNTEHIATTIWCAKSANLVPTLYTDDPNAAPTVNPPLYPNKRPLTRWPPCGALVRTWNPVLYTYRCQIMNNGPWIRPYNTPHYVYRIRTHRWCFPRCFCLRPISTPSLPPPGNPGKHNGPLTWNTAHRLENVPTNIAFVYAKERLATPIRKNNDNTGAAARDV